MKKLLIPGIIATLPVAYFAANYSSAPLAPKVSSPEKSDPVAYASPEERMASGYLDEGHKALQEVPRDGRLGVSRLPTIHGLGRFHDPKDEKSEAVKSLKGLQESNYLACGTWSATLEKGRIRHSTVPSLYQLNWKDAVKSTADFDAMRSFAQDFGPSETQKLLASGKPYGTATMKYAEREARFYMRVVKANKNECVSCHTNVKVGDPVGVIGLLCLPK